MQKAVPHILHAVFNFPVTEIQIQRSRAGVCHDRMGWLSNVVQTWAYPQPGLKVGSGFLRAFSVDQI